MGHGTGTDYDAEIAKIKNDTVYLRLKNKNRSPHEKAIFDGFLRKLKDLEIQKNKANPPKEEVKYFVRHEGMGNLEPGAMKNTIVKPKPAHKNQKTGIAYRNQHNAAKKNWVQVEGKTQPASGPGVTTNTPGNILNAIKEEKNIRKPLTYVSYTKVGPKPRKSESETRKEKLELKKKIMDDKSKKTAKITKPVKTQSNSDSESSDDSSESSESQNISKVPKDSTTAAAKSTTQNNDITLFDLPTSTTTSNTTNTTTSNTTNTPVSQLPKPVNVQVQKPAVTQPPKPVAVQTVQVQKPLLHTPQRNIGTPALSKPPTFPVTPQVAKLPPPKVTKLEPIKQVIPIKKNPVVPVKAPASTVIQTGLKPVPPVKKQNQEASKDTPSKRKQNKNEKKNKNEDSDSSDSGDIDFGNLNESIEDILQKEDTSDALDSDE